MVTFLSVLVGSVVTASPGIQLEKIIDNNMVPPEILSIESPVSCLGDVFFTGIDDSNRIGLYAATSQGFTVVADSTTPVPGSSETFQFAAIAECAGDRLLFLGDGNLSPQSPAASIYAYAPGGITPVLETGTPIGDTQFRGFSFLDATDTDLVVDARLSPASVNQAIVLTPEGTPIIVADRSTVLPGQTDPVTIMAWPILAGSDVVFHGRTGFTLGLYRWRPGAGLSLVVDTQTPVPIPGQGNFGRFGVPAYVGGRVVFPGGYAGGQEGLFAFQNGRLEPVVLPGDVTDDGEVLLSAERPIGAGDLLSFIGRVEDDPAFFDIVFVKRGDGPVQRVLGVGDVVDGYGVSAVFGHADHRDVLVLAFSPPGFTETIYRARFPAATSTEIPALSWSGALALALALAFAGWWTLRSFRASGN